MRVSERIARWSYTSAVVAGSVLFALGCSTTGEPQCTRNADCASLRCVSGVCMPVDDANVPDPTEVGVDDDAAPDGSSDVDVIPDGEDDATPGADVGRDVVNPDAVDDAADAVGDDAADAAPDTVPSDTGEDAGDTLAPDDVHDPDAGIATCESLGCEARNRVCEGEDGVTRCGGCLPAFRLVGGACVPLLTRDAPLGERCLESRTCADGLWCASTGPFQNWRCAPALRLGESTMEFAWIPPGSVRIGSPVEEQGRTREEQVLVEFTRDLLVQRTEVTQTQWVAMYARNPSERASPCGDCPVENVTWWSAMDFANRLSERDDLAPCYVLPTFCTGNAADGTLNCQPMDALPELATPTFDACDGYRLPTESEWEYAARAGTTGATWRGTLTGNYGACESGAPAMDEMAWWCNNANSQTQPSGQREANPWGLYDMLGNVWEWTLDAEVEGALGAAGGRDPLPADLGPRRVARGGAYSSFLAGLRAGMRVFQPPGSAARNRGFRLVRRPSAAR